MKLELFRRKCIFFMERAFSKTDMTVLVNTNRSALIRSVFNKMHDYVNVLGTCWFSEDVGQVIIIAKII